MTIPTSQAYLNHGRWVADCPVPGCKDALALYPQHPQTGQLSPTPVYEQTCVNGHRFRLDAPPDDMRARIEVALAERLSHTRRNWFPKDHPMALAYGYPHGQSVDDLKRESAVGEQGDAADIATKRAEALAYVRSLDIPLDQVLAALKEV